MSRDQQFEQAMVGYEEWYRNGGEALVNSELDLTSLMQAAFFGGTEYRQKTVDWRAHSAQFARGQRVPDTLESAQAAWDRDQEVIFGQRLEIAKLKDKINKLEQLRDVKDAKRWRYYAGRVAQMMGITLEAMTKEVDGAMEREHG